MSISRACVRLWFKQWGIVLTRDLTPISYHCQKVTPHYHIRHYQLSSLTSVLKVLMTSLGFLKTVMWKAYICNSHTLHYKGIINDGCICDLTTLNFKLIWIQLLKNNLLTLLLWINLTVKQKRGKFYSANSIISMTWLHHLARQSATGGVHFWWEAGSLVNTIPHW